MGRNDDIQELFERFMRASNLMDSMHGDLISLEDGQPLTVAEIHLIDAIGKHPKANMTELADITGRTKGALSQLSSRLQKKGLIRKGRRADNNRDVVLTLTEEGRSVYDAHDRLHADLYEEIASDLGEMDEKSIEALLKISDSLERHLEEYKEMFG
ncbi:MAG: MarR family winged helix-turn-helix transcriptional regulator [Coriobacteriales bacterium]